MFNCSTWQNVNISQFHMFNVYCWYVLLLNVQFVLNGKFSFVCCFLYNIQHFSISKINNSQFHNLKTSHVQKQSNTSTCKELEISLYQNLNISHLFYLKTWSLYDFACVLALLLFVMFTLFRRGLFRKGIWAMLEGPNYPTTVAPLSWLVLFARLLHNFFIWDPQK